MTSPLFNRIQVGKPKRLKKHVSWITVHEELTLSQCTVEGCCSGLVHCPLCLPVKCPPQSSQDIEIHFKESHLLEAVKTDEFVVMVCCLNCGVMKVPHYHCPVCGLMLKTAASMKQHLQCNCIIKKLESACTNQDTNVQPKKKVVAEPELQQHARSRVIPRVGGKPAGQSIWETQTKLKPDAEQRERRKQLLSHMPYPHQSMVFDVTDFDIYRCGTCCSGFHCPLCPTETFTPSNPKKVLDHLENTHIREQVQYKGLKIMKCRLDCLPSRTRIGQSHYHCPLCPMKISIPPRFQTHIECHEKGTNKIHKRHKQGMLTQCQSEEPDVREECSVQEAVEYRIVSGVDEGGNAVEIEVTVPKNASDAAALDSALQYLLPNGNFEIRQEGIVQMDIEGESHEFQGESYIAEEVPCNRQESGSFYALPLNSDNIIATEVSEDKQIEGQMDTQVQGQGEMVTNTEDGVDILHGEKPSHLQGFIEETCITSKSHEEQSNSAVRKGVNEAQVDYHHTNDKQIVSEETFESVESETDETMTKSMTAADVVTESGIISHIEIGSGDQESDEENTGEVREMGSCKESNQNIPVLQNDDTTYVAFTDQSSGPGVADTSEQLLEGEHVSVSMTTKSLQAVRVPCDELCELLAQNFSVSCTYSKNQEDGELTISGSWENITQSRECISRVIRQKPLSTKELKELVLEYRQEIDGIGNGCKGGETFNQGLKSVELEGGNRLGCTKVEEVTVTDKKLVIEKAQVFEEAVRNEGTKTVKVQEARNGYRDDKTVSLDESTRATEGCSEEGRVEADEKFTGQKTQVCGDVGRNDGSKRVEEVLGRRSSRKNQGAQVGKYREMLKGFRAGYGEKNVVTRGLERNGGERDSEQKGLKSRDEIQADEETLDKVENSDNQQTEYHSCSAEENLRTGAKRKLPYESEGLVYGVADDTLLKKEKMCKVDINATKLKYNTTSRGEMGAEDSKSILNKEVCNTEVPASVVTLKPALYIQGKNVVTKEEQKSAGDIKSEQYDDEMTKLANIQESSAKSDIASEDVQISIPTVDGGDVNVTHQESHTVLASGSEVCLPGETVELCPICNKFRGATREELLMHILSTDCIQSCHRKKRNLAKGLCTQIDRMHKCRSSVCFLCKREFSGIKQAKIHYALMMCCKKQKKNPHNIPKHPKSGQYFCELCEYEASIPHKVWQHMQRKHLQKEYPCDMCTELFTTQKFMEVHKERVHMDTAKSVCEHCGKELYTKYMKRHYNDVHNPNYTRASRVRQQEILQCTHCQYTTLILDDLNRHMRRQHGERNYHCHVCSATFAFQGDLNLHMKTIHGVREVVKCQFCDKQVLKKHLSMHIRNIHENVKSFTCPVCGKGLQTKFSLKYHIETHKKPQDRQYKFKCSSCDSGFMNRSVLRDHMNCHTGNRPYQCQMCHKSFRQRSVYHKHLEIHNNVKFMCAFCGLIFASKKAVFDHKEMVHSEPQLMARTPNVCVCGVTAESAYMLTRHQEDCPIYQATVQIQGCEEQATDTTGQKGLGSSSGNGTIVEGILHDGGNSLISPQEAAAILEQEGSEFMAREVIQLDNGTMLVIQEENKEESELTGSINQGDSETIENSSYLCGYCSVSCQSMDEIEQHMLTLHSAEETSGNRLIAELGEGHKANLPYTHSSNTVTIVGQCDQETNQSEQLIQTVSQSGNMIVSQSSQFEMVEQIATSDGMTVLKSEPEEPLNYEVLT